MGIPLGDSQRGRSGRRRRSYSRYDRPDRNPGPRNDPFRMVFYLVIIIGCLWVYNNQDEVRTVFADTFLGDGQPAVTTIDEETGEVVRERPTATPELDAAGYAALGAEAFQSGQLEEAIEYYREANTRDPNNPAYPFEAARITLYLSALQYGEEREATLEQAMELADLAINANPERPEGYAIAGKIMDWQGEPQEGRNMITRALTFDEDFALAHSYLAEAQVDLESYDEAVESIEYALSLNPGDVDILRDYAYVLESLTQYTDAIAQYEQAIAINPSLPYLRVALARNYRVLGRCNEALDQLLAAQPFAVDNAVIAYELGITYEACVGDPPSAVGAYEQAVDLDPEYLSPWLRLGQVRYFAGQYPEAIIALERAVELDAMEINDSIALTVSYQLGYSYAINDQCIEALPYLNDASDLLDEEDDLILDVINTAYEICEAPPVELPDEEAGSGGATP